MHFHIHEFLNLKTTNFGYGIDSPMNITHRVKIKKSGVFQFKKVLILYVDF